MLETGDGPERVHVVHGNQDDHYNAFIDIRSPIDTPMGHHVVREVLPELEKADKPGSLLEGIPWLNDSSQIAEPELSVVGPGFYANSGCGVVVVGAHPSRFGLPRPFLAFRRCSRVELAADDVLRVQLVVGDTPVPSVARLERFVARSHTDVPASPRPVAALPGGAQWPTDPGRLPSWVGRRRTRRVAAILLALAGVMNVVSVLLPTIGSRLHGVEQVVPIHVPRVAGVLAVLGGLALIGLARRCGGAIARRTSPAWSSWPPWPWRWCCAASISSRPSSPWRSVRGS